MLRLGFVALLTISSFTTIASAESREIRVEFDTPATNYGVSIRAVYGVGDSLWVISEVTKTGDIGGAAITRVSDEVTIDAAKDGTRPFYSGEFDGTRFSRRVKEQRLGQSEVRCFETFRRSVADAR